jgi:hypothetical protein
MRNAPFEEIEVAARHRLGAVLAELNPSAGFKGEGDGRGSKRQKKSMKNEAPETKPWKMQRMQRDVAACSSRVVWLRSCGRRSTIELIFSP